MCGRKPNILDALILSELNQGLVKLILDIFLPRFYKPEIYEQACLVLCPYTCSALHLHALHFHSCQRDDKWQWKKSSEDNGSYEVHIFTCFELKYSNRRFTLIPSIYGSLCFEPSIVSAMINWLKACLISRQIL